MPHTPGPWTATGWEGVVVNDSTGTTLALCPGDARRDGLESVKANARLIAAAPDLLEALEGCWGMLYQATDVIDKARRQQWDGVRPTDLHVIDLESCRSWYNQARAAITKAKGE